ncbi:MAG: ABC transporter ATP-binding protein [Clostridia bacterium]|nr:ABC transporter ATP-binding protein [Clostridia bacterium]
MIKKLARHIGEYKLPSLLTPIFILFEVGIEVSIPFVISRLIDVGIQGDGGITYVIEMGAIMLALALASLACGALAGRTGAVASVGFAKNLRNALFQSVQDFSFSNVDKFSTPSLITRLTTDVTNVQTAYMMIIRGAVRSPLMLVCATSFALGINWKLSLIFIGAIPVLAVGAFFLLTSVHPRFVRLLKKFDLINADVQEDLAGIRVVKTFVREDHESEKFRKSSEELRAAQIKAEKVMVLAMPLMMTMIYACIILVLYLGGGFIVQGEMTVGQLTSFLTYIMQILLSFMMLAVMLVNIMLSRASAQRIVEVLDEKPDITDAPDAIQERPENGKIEFRNVKFCYRNSENAALEGIDFTLESGETLGIIGGTGSAKSTLVQLIPRLYDVTEGEVLVGGKNVKDYGLVPLRDSVAMVLQKNVLFSGTIKENLLWGNEDATDEEIAEACKIADAYDFVIARPDGFETDLGQGGVNVSGGQKQRLCIARALLKKPQVMILDDSTSAVDTATDRKIREGLKKNLKDMTTIIIAQRIASVMDADKILVLDNGRMDGFGTHEELLKTNEIYREVYESQVHKEDE